MTSPSGTERPAGSYFLFLKYRLIRRICSSRLNIAASQLVLGEDTPHNESAAAQETAALLFASGSEPGFR
jgi:hypothetical protein